MRSSRDIEGVTRLCDAGSVERTRRKRGWKLCIRTYIRRSRGEGCSVSMVTRWLIGRTTDAGRRWCVGVGWKILGRIPCSLWSIIPHQERGWLWSVRWPWQCPITSRKLHLNMRGCILFASGAQSSLLYPGIKICGLSSIRRYMLREDTWFILLLILFVSFLQNCHL